MSKVSTVIDICGLISLILLLIGIEKVNKFNTHLKNKDIYGYISLYYFKSNINILIQINVNIFIYIYIYIFFNI